ncbi:MAG TPA: hypothetical protein VEH77_18235, partial [Roseiarcus sp.]|nr:hypothetical protein [Roseiarcus sp.]
ALASKGAAHGADGRIVGHIDRVISDDSGSHVRGWACQQGRPESIDIHIFAGDSPTKEHVVHSGMRTSTMSPPLTRCARTPPATSTGSTFRCPARRS